MSQRYLQLLIFVLAGGTFSLGLIVSQMINPEKVLGFLDVFGNWDPSLAFVMAGAIATTFVGYRLIFRRGASVFGGALPIFANTTVDRRLIIGSTLFGVGWGLIGLCPGPALAAVGVSGPKVLAFVGAMVLGMLVEPRLAQLLGPKR